MGAAELYDQLNGGQLSVDELGSVVGASFGWNCDRALDGVLAELYPQGPRWRGRMHFILSTTESSAVLRRWRSCNDPDLLVAIAANPKAPQDLLVELSSSDTVPEGVRSRALVTLRGLDSGT